MEFPVLLLLGTFVAIIAVAIPMLSHGWPFSYDQDQPSNFESRLADSRARRNAVGAGALAAATAGGTTVDLRKKKKDGDSDSGGAELVALGDTSDAGGGDSDGGSSCGGGGCGGD